MSNNTWLTRFRDLSVALLAVIASVFGVTLGIDYLVEKKVNDSSFIEKIAAKVRPSMIINSKGSILYDAGGGEFIFAPKITTQTNNPKETYIIEIEGRKHLHTAPLLECINSTFDIISRRGKGNVWLYIVKDAGFVSDGTTQEHLFRIEIIGQ